MLRTLNVSYNKIGSIGMMKLLSRLKKSGALTSMIMSGNDLSENQDKFVSLQKFLSRNESCTSLVMTACSLKDQSMVFFGAGLAMNTALVRLNLAENDLLSKEGLNHFMKGLIDNKKESKLIEIDFSKCRFMSKMMQPFAKLFSANYKIRHLNLKNNNITDDGAGELLESMVSNEFITKVVLDMNPIKFNILKEIEAHTKGNMNKVNAQEVPSMIEEIIEVKKSTAQALYDCAMDPLIQKKV